MSSTIRINTDPDTRKNSRLAVKSASLSEEIPDLFRDFLRFEMTVAKKNRSGMDSSERVPFRASQGTLEKRTASFLERTHHPFGIEFHRFPSNCCVSENIILNTYP